MQCFSMLQLNLLSFYLSLNRTQSNILFCPGFIAKGLIFDKPRTLLINPVQKHIDSVRFGGRLQIVCTFHEASAQRRQAFSALFPLLFGHILPVFLWLFARVRLFSYFSGAHWLLFCAPRHYQDFDKKLIIDERTQEVARRITKFLKENDRFAKTIVFCVDIEHAERMRQALVNENSDIIKDNPRYDYNNLTALWEEIKEYNKLKYYC